MADKNEFSLKIKSILNEIGDDVLLYDKAETWMYEAVYSQIEFYAYDHQLTNTAIALPLARGLHNGTHRKSQITRNGLAYHLPYLIHPLLVCRMLVDLQVPLSKEEEDIMLAAALCHDMIEDLPFEHHGRELYEIYHLDPRVYETVLLVSKRKDFSEEEERAFFRKIRENKLALLIKLSDRGNNVEDLYNMSVWKVHEYVGETKKFFLPMCQHGIANFPELYHTIEILLDKMVLLTEASETLVDRYEAEEKKLIIQGNTIRNENVRLRNIWNTYLETGHTIADAEDIPYTGASLIEDQIEEGNFSLNTELSECEDLYKSIEIYAAEKKLLNTLSSLSLLKDSLLGPGMDGNVQDTAENYKHVLLAAKMLIDLHPILSREEEDITLSAVLCHILFEILPFDDLPNVFHLNEDVYEATKLVIRQKVLHVKERHELYNALLSSKSACLAKLADQSIHVQQLYGLSIWEAQEWIRETRTFILPLCISAREKYGDVYPVISILMEKMRSLIEVTDILSSRYRQREDTLTKEVFSLMEENARISGMIRNLSGR